MAPASNPASSLPMDIPATLGAIYIGSSVTTLLFGVTCAQTYYYFAHYPEDKRIIKIAVIALWALDAFHCILICHGIYHYAVESYGDKSALTLVPWTLVTQVLIGAFSDTIVRLFYVHRTWILSDRNRLLGGFLLLCVIVALAADTTAFAVLARNLNLPTILKKDQWAVYFALACVASVDIIVASALCIRMVQKKTEFKRTQSLVKTLVVYSVRTALMTCGVSILCLISFATMPASGNLVFMAIDFALPVLYINCALTLLNTRKNLRKALNGSTVVSIPLPEINQNTSSAESVPRSPRQLDKATVVAIRVTKESVEHVQ